MKAKPILSSLMLIMSFTLFSQTLPIQTDEAKQAEWREIIELDLTIADFETKTIDSNVIGNRLARILDYLMENYQQGVYDRRLSQIASEQNEALDNVYFQLKKIKLINAAKKGNIITILLHADLQKNAANIKQTDIMFQFVDGISESDKVNELFSYISHYVQAREHMIQQIFTILDA